jgi:hypothetical protein
MIADVDQTKNPICLCIYVDYTKSLYKLRLMGKYCT